VAALSTLTRREVSADPQVEVDDAVAALKKAGALAASGNLEAAQPLYEHALAVSERTFGSGDATVATVCHALGVLHAQLGNPLRAEPYLARAFEIRRRTSAEPTIELLTTMVDLARVLHDDGQYERAQQMVLAIGAVGSTIRTRDQQQRAALVGALNHGFLTGALLAEEADDLEGAEKILRTCLDQAIRAGTPRLQIEARHSLTAFLMRRGRLDEAQDRYEELLPAIEKEFGPESREVVTELGNLANVYFLRSKDQWAASYFDRAVTLGVRKLGAEDPSVTGLLEMRALFHLAVGKGREARLWWERAWKAAERRRALVFLVGSEQQRTTAKATMADDLSLAIAMHLQYAPDDPDAADLAARVLLQTKSRVASSLAEVRTTLRRRRGSAVEAALARWSTLTGELARIVLASGSRGLSDDVQQKEAALATVEKTLLADLQSMGASREFPQVGDVAARLRRGEVLVDLVQYSQYFPRCQTGKRWGPLRYALCLIRPQGPPTWVDVGLVAELDALIDRYRHAIAGNGRNVNSLARRVDGLVFGKVSAEIDRAERLYVSPDGLLNLLPFAALTTRDGKARLERQEIVLLASGRDLLRSPAGAVTAAPPLVVGAPDFDARPQGARGVAASGKIGARIASLEAIQFPALPGTDAEVSDIGKIVDGARVLRGKNATEAAVKQAQSPRILHIATHGFFLGSGGEGGRGEARGVGGLSKITLATSAAGKSGGAPSPASAPTAPSPPLPKDALLRSGLVLAGANSGGDGVDDGLLTAREVSTLDLSGTELVVLSACETGEGRLLPGEGVSGLRSALMMAGARSQILSLWRVSDQSTTQLMTAFYEALRQGAPPSAALRQAQLRLLRQRATAHPYHWAAFTFSGGAGETAHGENATGRPR
jgi:CHAT domain-containing protein